MMTKEQWVEIEGYLCRPYGSAKLLIDGNRITLETVYVGSLKYEILVYIDGWSKSEWLTKDCEERRRFLRPCVHSLYSAKDIALLTKGYSKSELKNELPRWNQKFTSYSLSWPSFGPLKRHLIKHNQSISLAVEP